MGQIPWDTLEAAAPGIRVELPPSPRHDTWGSSPQAESQAGSFQISFPEPGQSSGMEGTSRSSCCNTRNTGKQLGAIPLPGIPGAAPQSPNTSFPDGKCLWNTFSTLQDPALEQTVASLQWESFHHNHPSSGTSQGESYSCCKNSDRHFCLHHFSSIVYHRNLSKITLYIFIYIYV